MKKYLLLLLSIVAGCSTQTTPVSSVVIQPSHTPVPPLPSITKSILVQNTPGYDVLGLATYCRTFLSAPKLPAVSTLYGNGSGDFGDPFPCLEKRIAQGGIQKVQMDLVDATCVRNNVCPKGSPSLPALSTVRARAKVLNAHAILHPEIEWWASPYLEQDIKDPAVINQACSTIHSVCPTCHCLNSPFTGARPSGIPVELHGTQSKAFSVSADGSSIFDGDTLKNDGNNFQFRNAGTSQTYAWWNALNNRCTGEHSFTPIINRTERPEAWQFQLANHLMTTDEDAKPANPPQCKSVREVNGAEIVKPTAEKYCNGSKDDGRGNKPLLIIRKNGKRGDKLNVYNTTGTLVGCFAYFGPYTRPGTYRWYMGSCSGQNAWELYTDMKSQEWAFADLGNGQCLRFNTVRRMGVYR